MVGPSPHDPAAGRVRASAPAGDSRPSILLSAAGVAGGLFLFAWFAHGRWPANALGATGFLLAAAAILGTTPRDIELVSWLGVGAAPPAGLCVLGAGIGLAAGFAQRASLHIPLIHGFAIEPFVLIACLIGATEEVIYRGWLLSRLRGLGWPVAIVLAALAHAAYKTALFAQPTQSVPIDYVSLALLTAIGGVVLGALRAVSGSLWPAIAAHAVFDFVVYRAVAHAPWWVWG